MADLQRHIRYLETVRIKPSPAVNELIRSKVGSKITEAMSGAKLLRRPEISAEDLICLGILGPETDTDLRSQIEIRMKYYGYIDRQIREADQFKRMEKAVIPHDMDYDRVPGLSRELRERLKLVRPHSMGQVSRIAGITPAALSALMVNLRGGRSMAQRAAESDVL